MRRASLFVSLLIGIAAAGCGGSSSSTGAGGNGGSAGNGGSTGGNGGSTGNGGSSGNGGADAGGGAGGALAACGNDNQSSSGDTCNTVEATGPCVTATESNGTPPSATGGTIQAGTYDLTSETNYGTPDGSNDNPGAKRETLMFTVNGSNRTLANTHVSGTTVQRQAGSVTISGAMATFTPTCPPPGDGGDNGGSVAFTATATTFTLIEMRGDGSTRVDVYTKR
jgi:hypothetical protein